MGRRRMARILARSGGATSKQLSWPLRHEAHSARRSAGRMCLESFYEVAQPKFERGRRSPTLAVGLDEDRAQQVVEHDADRVDGLALVESAAPQDAEELVANRGHPLALEL